MLISESESAREKMRQATWSFRPLKELLGIRPIQIGWAAYLLLVALGVFLQVDGIEQDAGWANAHLRR